MNDLPNHSVLQGIHITKYYQGGLFLSSELLPNNTRPWVCDIDELVLTMNQLILLYEDLVDQSLERVAGHKGGICFLLCFEWRGGNWSWLWWTCMNGISLIEWVWGIYHLHNWYSGHPHTHMQLTGVIDELKLIAFTTIITFASPFNFSSHITDHPPGSHWLFQTPLRTQFAVCSMLFQISNEPFSCCTISIMSACLFKHWHLLCKISSSI